MSHCILFDLDGTLVDTEALCQQAFLDLLPRLSCSKETMVNRYQGVHFDDILADLVEREEILPPDDFEHLYRAHLDELLDRELQPTPGAVDMLRLLNYPYCIASGAPMAKIRRSLRIAGMTKFFGERIFSSYTVGSWKPDPNLFLHASKVMGFRPEECIVIEDSEPGIEAAIRAGMTVLHYSPRGAQASVANIRRLRCWADLPPLLENVG